MRSAIVSARLYGRTLGTECQERNAFFVASKGLCFFSSSMVVLKVGWFLILNSDAESQGFSGVVSPCSVVLVMDLLWLREAKPCGITPPTVPCRVLQSVNCSEAPSSPESRSQEGSPPSTLRPPQSDGRTFASSDDSPMMSSVRLQRVQPPRLSQVVVRTDRHTLQQTKTQTPLPRPVTTTLFQFSALKKGRRSTTHSKKTRQRRGRRTAGKATTSGHAGNGNGTASPASRHEAAAAWVVVIVSRDRPVPHEWQLGLQTWFHVCVVHDTFVEAEQCKSVGFEVACLHSSWCRTGGRGVLGCFVRNHSCKR